MFERFTDKARRAVVLAQEEARTLDHNYIGTEHLLLGLLREEDGVAARALGSLGVSLEAVRRDVEAIIGRGEAVPKGHIPFTPRAKKVLELALREALQLGHNYIGTEHILLGLVREGEGVAAQVLQKLGADLNRVRQTVVQLLSGYAGTEAASGGWSVEHEVEKELDAPLRAAVTTEDFPTCVACGAALSETLAVRAIEVTVDEAVAVIKVAYCGRCGGALGTVP